MPTAEAPGKLKNRDDKKLVNTDKEKVSRWGRAWKAACVTCAPVSPSDSLPASEGSVRAAVQGVCGAGLLRGPLPLPQPVRRPGHHGRGALTHGRLRLQVQQLPGRTGKGFPIGRRRVPTPSWCAQVDVDGEHFLRDLRKDVQKSIGFDAIMRVRTSTGE